MKKVLAVMMIGVIAFFALHITYKGGDVEKSVVVDGLDAQQVFETQRTIFNNVWDKTNARLMTTPGVGAQGTFETVETILNNVWDKTNNMLRVSGSGGEGGGDVSSNTASSVDNEIAVFSGTAGKTIKRGVGTGYAFLTDGVLTAVAGVEGFVLKGQSQVTATTYTLLASDEAKLTMFLNSSPIAVTLANPTTPGFTNGALFLLRNIGQGLVTATPTGATINGSATLTIRTGETAFVISNGITYAAFTSVSNPMTGVGDLVYGGTNGQLTRLAAGTGFLRANGASAPTITPLARALVFSVGDPGGDALVAGATVTAYATVPFACTLTAWNLLVDAGTVTVKFWKVASGIAIPTGSNSINTSGVGISTGTAIHSTTMTDFTTVAVTKDDIIAMNVVTSATAKYVSATLQCDQ